MVNNAELSLQQTNYDNWNGATYSYTLYFLIGVNDFVRSKKSIPEYGDTIKEQIDLLCSRLDNESITKIKIIPNATTVNCAVKSSEFGSINGVDTAISNEPTFWKPRYFKLFISHLASFKIVTSALKSALESYGISAFVAHEDIEPTKEWQHEIKRGLFTMDALCAILMPKFKESNWTDQEIGIAIGRNILIVPVRKGLDPYGFIGKYQGFQAGGKNVGEVAYAIFDILSSNMKTRDDLILKLSELFLL